MSGRSPGMIINLYTMSYYIKQQLKSNGKWYPKAKTIGKPVTTAEVAKKLADLSSLSTGDVKSVLDLLGGVLADFMNSGRTVKLEGVGTFYYTVNAEGNGVDTADKVNAKQIKGTRVRFIPEVSRGTKSEITTRSLVGPGTFWELLDENIPAQPVDDTTPGTGGEDDDDSGQGTFG